MSLLRVLLAVLLLHVPAAAAATAEYGADDLWNRPTFRAHGAHVFISGLIAEQQVRALRNHQGAIETVSLNSTGGRVPAVLEAARFLRQRQVTTYVGFGAACISGCTLLFQAGEQRIIHPRAVLGYHRPRNADDDTHNTHDTDSKRKQLRAFRDLYLKLGLPRALLEEFWHPGIVVYHGATRLAKEGVATQVRDLGLAVR